jgi:hypothetical protein
VELLNQLTSKLGLAGILIAFDLDLAQSRRRAPNHELAQPYAVTAATQRIECFTHTWRFSD